MTTVKRTCPFCREVIAYPSTALACNHCDTYHHLECWRANDGCSLFGCGSAQHFLPSPTLFRLRRLLSQDTGLLLPALTFFLAPFILRDPFQRLFVTASLFCCLPVAIFSAVQLGQHFLRAALLSHSDFRRFMFYFCANVLPIIIMASTLLLPPVA